MKTRSKRALDVSWFGFWVNLALSSLKILSGILGKSSAMVADGFHSLSDLATDIGAIWAFKMVSVPPDSTHKYGHGKFETLCQAVIGLVLVGGGLGILWSSSLKVLDFFRGSGLSRPKAVALWAAVLSIGVKEGLYRYTAFKGLKLNSPTLRANAWHHRSDALSSIGTLAGIGGAMAFGGWGRLLDPGAGIIVSFIVLAMGWSITKDAGMELSEASLPEKVSDEIKSLAMGVPGVKEIHALRTRRVGAAAAMDFHLLVDPSMTVKEGHDIATAVEEAIKAELGQETMISVHLEPYERSLDKHTPLG